MALLLAFEYIWNAMPWTGLVWSFGNPFQVWKDWFQDADFLPFPWANVCLCFLMGAEAGAATLPFADSGRELVARSLVHYAATAATVSVWVVLNFGQRGTLPSFLIPLTLIYALVWLGRWVGWYAEVAAIREKLGLAPGPSFLKWRETLPYLPFVLLLCGILPVFLRWAEVEFQRGSMIEIPVLSALILPFVLMPVGGFFAGVSLGKRQGVCILYPAACFVCYLPMVYLVYNYTALFHCFMVAVPALAGNVMGWAYRRAIPKKGRGAV